MKMTEVEKQRVQEIINVGYLGVIKQGGKSMDPYVGIGACRYRGLAGFKCFIGHSIPNEKYEKRMEGMLASLLYTWPELLGIPMRDTDPDAFAEALNILFACQQCHDQDTRKDEQGDFLTVFKKRMKDVTKKFGFTLPEIPNAE